MEELKDEIKMGSKLLLYSAESFAANKDEIRACSSSFKFSDHNSMKILLENVKSSSANEIKVTGFLPDSDTQGHLYRILKATGKVVILGVPTRDAGVELTNDMKMMGFEGVLVAKENTDEASRFLVAQKPNWGNSSSAAVKTPYVMGTKWTVGVEELAEMDLVDEDDLLNDGVQVDSEACAPPADGGKKRACKNCSCGLAELEAAELKDAQTKIAPLVRASGCGNCSKGDAFRCASCPFLGKPAFEPGQEKVVLAMDDDI